MMWHSFFAYLKYLFKSKSKFSVHSPFVYEFITKTLQTPLPVQFGVKLKKYRDVLLSDNSLIRVTDFGAGSRFFSTNNRKICDIARVAGISNTKAALLQKIVFHFHPANILEIGTSLGIATAAMSIVNPKSQITSVEGCEETASKAKDTFTQHQIKNINVVIGEFSIVLPDIFKNNTFDLIYFDGNHQKEATIAYFKNCLKSVHNDSLLIFDDIHWSKEMEQAWELIKNETCVTLTIDLYHIGLVFFRKEQTKQNFILQY